MAAPKENLNLLSVNIRSKLQVQFFLQLSDSLSTALWIALAHNLRNQGYWRLIFRFQEDLSDTLQTKFFTK